VRITAQLIEAATDQNLWAESYERDLRDVLSLQSDVARAIAQEIKVKLTVQEESLLAHARPVNPEAHEAYLMGVFYENTQTAEGLSKAVEYLHQAIDADPNYALAYSNLAYCHSMSVYWGFTPPQEDMPKAKAAALKAIELDDKLAEAHASLGWVSMMYDWNWQAAERELKLAIKLNPGSARGHRAYGDYLAAIGRPEEGMAEKRRAQELDPLSPISNIAVAWQLHLLRQYDEEIEQCKKILVLEPDFLWAHLRLSQAYYMKGMYEESLEAHKKMFTLSGHSDVAEVLDRGNAASGYKGAMLMAAELLAEQSSVHWATTYFVMADERDKAFQWLEIAFEEHDPLLIYLRIWPMFDVLHSDPRFQDLLQRMNFPE
jgi:tetratricopeptide (TPR) repeat protein